MPEPSHAAVAIEFLPVSLFAKGGLARDEAALERSVRATRRARCAEHTADWRATSPGATATRKIGSEISRILLASVDGIAHSLARYCTDMSACEWRVRVAPRAASLAPRIRVDPRADAAFHPGAHVGVSNRNRAPVPHYSPSGRGRSPSRRSRSPRRRRRRARQKARRETRHPRRTPATTPGPARLEQRQNAYTNRALSMGYMAPKLPERYFVRVEPPVVGSGKTRIVVTLGADDGTGAGGEVVGWVTCWVKKSGANALPSPGAVAEGDALFLSSVEVKVAPGDGHRVEAPSRGRGPGLALVRPATSRRSRCSRTTTPAIALYESRGYAIDDEGSRLAARKPRRSSPIRSVWCSTG